MKNKEFYKLLNKNRSKSNSGFTLTELLVGLIMSIFVVGALGFGLMTVLRATQTETSKVKARNETSRALDFVSDEVRRASNIETNADNANGFVGTGRTVVLALNIPEINTSATLGSDTDTNTQERIVYYLQNTNNANWKGPLVLYRYGPPLGADGNYTAGDWDTEALIDGIDNTTIAATPCPAGDTLTPAVGTASGFHACINDGGNTAQLFLTGGTDTAAGEGTDTYTADTKVVARARTAPANRRNVFRSYTMSYKTLGATYNCNPNAEMWKMRTDFGNNPSNGDDTTSWIHEDDRQPQPIKIDTSKALKITSVPVSPGAANCLSKGDPTTTGIASDEPLSAYSDGTFPKGHTVSHTIEFSGNDYWLTFNGDPETGINEQTNVKGDGTTLMLKRGSTLASTLDGYDFDDDGTENQDSLGKFLEEKGYADAINGGGYIINDKLGTDERIMAVEVGHTDTSQPGFDIQDSVFILSSDIFAQKHSNQPAADESATSDDSATGDDSTTTENSYPTDSLDLPEVTDIIE